MNQTILRIMFLTVFVFLVSVAALGQSGTRSRPIKVGDVAPAFSLTDQEGRQVTLAKSETPVVLVFYRGFW